MLAAPPSPTVAPLHARRHAGSGEAAWAGLAPLRSPSGLPRAGQSRLMRPRVRGRRNSTSCRMCPIASASRVLQMPASDEAAPARSLHRGDQIAPRRHCALKLRAVLRKTGLPPRRLSTLEIERWRDARSRCSLASTPYSLARRRSCRHRLRMTPTSPPHPRGSAASVPWAKLDLELARQICRSTPMFSPT